MNAMNAGTPTPVEAETAGDIFEIVAKVEEQESGVFDASLNRRLSNHLVEVGYSLGVVEVKENTEGDLFEIILTVEQAHNGVFRAAIARKQAKALVEAGCSR